MDSQWWQTNQYTWEPSSKTALSWNIQWMCNPRYFLEVCKVFFISLVLNYFICITCLMGELNFLSLYYQCFTCMPLATCSWLRWLSPLHLSVHQYLCSAQPVDHFPLLNIAWYKQKTLWLKQARKQASKQASNQPTNQSYIWPKSTMSILIFPFPFFSDQCYWKNYFFFYPLFV